MLNSNTTFVKVKSKPQTSFSLKIFNSNTTFVKVKYLILLSLSKILSDSNTTFVKVKCRIRPVKKEGVLIQIQHLLKLNS